MSSYLTLCTCLSSASANVTSQLLAAIPVANRIASAAQEFFECKFKNMKRAAQAWEVPYYTLHLHIQGHQPWTKNGSSN